MARYMVVYKQKHSYKLCECDIKSTYAAALEEALYVDSIGVASAITILKDSEGEDHIDNAGKFFLFRIVR